MRLSFLCPSYTEILLVPDPAPLKSAWLAGWVLYEGCEGRARPGSLHGADGPLLAGVLSTCVLCLNVLIFVRTPFILGQYTCEDSLHMRSHSEVLQHTSFGGDTLNP